MSSGDRAGLGLPGAGLDHRPRHWPDVGLPMTTQEGAALLAPDEDWYDGFRAAIRAVREMTGGGYDAEVEREATAQRMEDRLVESGGRVTAACEPPKPAKARTTEGNERG